MDKNFGNIIWTDHALNRMRERGIKQSDAWVTWKNPERSRYVKDKATWIYHKTFSGQRVEVVAKKNDDGRWIILSVWSKSLTDKKLKKKRQSFVEKVVKKFLGI